MTASFQSPKKRGQKAAITASVFPEHRSLLSESGGAVNG